MKRLVTIIGIIGLITIALVIGLAATPTGAADHLDAPLIAENPLFDINDIYAFQSPNNPDNTVLIMSVVPLAGVQNPARFRDGVYEFRINNQGSIGQDLLLKIHFGSPDANGVQPVRVRWIDLKTGEDEYIFRGMTGQDIPMKGGDGLFHAGLFDDPFFFDLVAFQDNLNFCPDGSGADFFAALNVMAMVLEIPSSLLTSSPDNPNIGIWGFVKKDGGRFERMGRPAINTVFIPSGQKDDFNEGTPGNDQQDFRDEVVATLLALGNDEATANALADVLLPDVLTFDVSSSAGFLNGRQLADDVIDAELALISGGAITTDCVDSNDKSFSNNFPYLAPPH